MTFQASDGKGRSFFNLVDGNYEDIEPSYIKEGPWLQAFGYSNSLCARATRAITNHAPIGEYHLRFFPNENFSCPYGNFSIELNQEDMFFMIARDIMGIGILEEICCVISSCS